MIKRLHFRTNTKIKYNEQNYFFSREKVLFEVLILKLKIKFVQYQIVIKP